VRIGISLLLVGALTACSGNTIDAGTNGAGHNSTAAVDAAADGATLIASLIQLVPTQIVSDGKSLFWVSNIPVALARPMISSMPVTGGTISTVVAEPDDASSGVTASLVGVDDANVYYTAPGGIYYAAGVGGLYRAPKDGGGSPALMAPTQVAAQLGSNLYWVENDLAEGGAVPISTFKTAPLDGGSPATIAWLPAPLGVQAYYSGMAVTKSAVFLLLEGVFPAGEAETVDTTGFDSFPIEAGADGGVLPVSVAGAALSVVCRGASYGIPLAAGESSGFYPLISDTDAIYCISWDLPAVLRVASDGTQTIVGQLVDVSSIVPVNLALDDTYVYWTDPSPAGTVMRVPKTGGTPSVIARGTSPLAIAVDATAVYWSDQQGNLWRLAK
jgi:hypothetical protein